ncbi:hypothetical protein ABTM69_20615, partial [Acinetobacter baumannii]
GTLIATFALIPAVGFSGTLVSLAAVNLLCALAALTLGRAVRPAEPEPDEAASRTAGTRRLAISLFVTGFLGIAFEVLVVRLAAQVL